jgi:hypothetical protein
MMIEIGAGVDFHFDQWCFNTSWRTLSSSLQKVADRSKWLGDFRF